jgi:excisionase family DNA binding protein
MIVEFPSGFEPLLSAAQAAPLLSIHSVTLLRWAREGKVPSIRLGRRVAFRTSQLEKWLASGYTEPVSRAA